jgi:cytochrome c oxidase subunit II
VRSEIRSHSGGGAAERPDVEIGMTMNSAFKGTSKGSGRLAFGAAAAVAGLVTLSVVAHAAAGQPTAGQMGLQDGVTPIMNQIRWFHDVLVNPIIIAISVFVMALLLYVMWAFSEKKNPVPSKLTHHTGLEVAWTVIPIFILIAIAVPSFKMLFFQYSFPKPDITIKAIGNAWFWDYEYPDNDKIKVTSNMITDEELLEASLGKDGYATKYGKLTGTDLTKAVYLDSKPLWLAPPDKYAGTRLVRQLSVDNEIAVPVNKVVHILITSNDVIHSWAVPSFGSKMQAVPGRITATWFQATKEGIYYGQCSVLCGKNHSAMPIAVRVVSDQAFANWVAAVKARDMKKARGILLAATEGLETRSVAELTNGLVVDAAQ